MSKVSKCSAGYTLLETVVAVALFSLVLLSVLEVSTAGWRASVEARGDYQVEDVARDALNAIVQGDTRVTPSIRGLVSASEVAVAETPFSALAYKVKGITSSGAEGRITVTYYLSNGEILRTVRDYGTSLVFCTTGGTKIASDVSVFDLAATWDPLSTRLLVQIRLKVVDKDGRSIMLETRVLPRNQGTGGV